MAHLTFNSYGKTRVRLLQVLRDRNRDEVVELSVKILLQGDFDDSYQTGNNSAVLPTDTMKNTVYVIARQKPVESIESFALDLGGHFLKRVRNISNVIVEIKQTPWSHISEHNGAFVQSARERRVTRAQLSRSNISIESGIRYLQILKTSHSAFTGFMKDEYTTLPEARDRLLGTVLAANWTYSDQALDFNRLHKEIRSRLLEVFAAHDSFSVQHTLYAMGEAVLATFNSVREIALTMPNKHCLLADLSRFGLDNPNQVFIPTDEPSGHIEARLTR